MPVTATITKEQRVGLYELVRNHLGGIGDVWIALEQNEDFATAERLGIEFGEDFRLLADIGWKPRMSEPAAAFSFKAKARFADNLYRARERAGLSQKKAASRAALTRARLDKVEAGEAIPSFDILIRLAGAYSMSVGELVEGVTWKPGWVENSGPAGYVVADE